MATPEQRRQKKLAKKRSKELVKKKTLARQKASLQSLAGQMQIAGQGKVDRCYMSEQCFSEMPSGAVILSRFLPDGRTGMAFLSVDAMCLGVRFASADVLFPGDVTKFVERIREKEPLRRVSPETACKFTQGAIEYAGRIGFEPAPSYRRIAPIWTDIDPAQCDIEFRYGGPDGKPLFVTESDDMDQHVFATVAKLQQNVGEGNFDVNYESMLASMDYPNGDNEFDAYDDPELDVDIDEDVELGSDLR